MKALAMVQQSVLPLTVLFLASGALAQSASGPQQAPPLEAPAPPEGAVSGLGDINLYPKRLVLTDRDRIGTIGLYNRSNVTGDYEITITDKLMLPDGRIVDLGSVTAADMPPEYRPASAMLRWSPRNVQLPGNESQTIRIMPRVPLGLPAGEYRSHFTVFAQPPVAAGGDAIDDIAIPDRALGIGVQLLPRFGISVPVILRIGETSLVSGITSIAYERTGDRKAALRVTLSREGTRSSFGDIVVTAAGTSKPAALLRGIGIYTEVTSRSVDVPFDAAFNPDLLHSGTKFTVSYIDDDYAPGTVLARKDFILP